jgi:hypothetical protein
MLSRLFAFTIMIHALVPAPVASGQSSSTPLLVMEQDGRVDEESVKAAARRYQKQVVECLRGGAQ